MKKITLLLVIFTLISIPLLSQEAFQNLIFSAGLDAAQQPHELAVASEGRGVAGITLADGRPVVNVTVNGLTGPITGAHMHEGKAGSSGGVVYPLSDFISGNKITGVLEDFDLSAAGLEKFLNGEYYINVHTTANPSGEIRGQIMLETDRALTAILDRDQAGIILTPENHIITVKNNFFEPSELTINPGDTVTFRWMQGNIPINVNFMNSPG